MLRQLYELAKRLLALTQDNDRNKAQIETLRQEVRNLSATVRELAYEVRRIRENESHEREKMALRLENALLHFERRLPLDRPREIEEEGASTQ